MNEPLYEESACHFDTHDIDNVLTLTCDASGLSILRNSDLVFEFEGVTYQELMDLVNFLNQHIKHVRHFTYPSS